MLLSPNAPSNGVPQPTAPDADLQAFNSTSWILQPSFYVPVIFLLLLVLFVLMFIQMRRARARAAPSTQRMPNAPPRPPAT